MGVGEPSETAGSDIHFSISEVWTQCNLHAAWLWWKVDLFKENRMCCPALLRVLGTNLGGVAAGHPGADTYPGHPAGARAGDVLVDTRLEALGLSTNVAPGDPDCVLGHLIGGRYEGVGDWSPQAG